jgi:hypothetical protein
MRFSLLRQPQYCLTLMFKHHFFMKILSKINIFQSIIFNFLIICLFLSCEKIDRFYRPNLPEKLSCIGIIDLDDTTNFEYEYKPFEDRTERTSARFISFEKSFQVEYPKELYDSLRELSFSISSSEGELYKYKSDSILKNFLGFDIPSSIGFHSGERYFLNATEKSTPEISAECTVPYPPSTPELVSYSIELGPFRDPSGCWPYHYNALEVIDFTFETNNNEELFYAILLEGYGTYSNSSVFSTGRSQIEFSIRNSNAPGFFAELNGFRRGRWSCINNLTSTIKNVSVNAYFIEGSKIPGNKCSIKISTQFDDIQSLFYYLEQYQVRLLSIPKDLFLFEKSLYAYGQNSKDPFSEPVNLIGNIKDGTGVFAVCRSRILTIYFPHSVTGGRPSFK